MTRHRIAHIGENRNPESPENCSQTHRFLRKRLLQARRSAALAQQLGGSSRAITIVWLYRCAGVRLGDSLRSPNRCQPGSALNRRPGWSVFIIDEAAAGDQTSAAHSVRARSSASVGVLPEHSFIIDAYEGENFFVARTDRLLMNLEAFGIPAVKSGIGTYFPRKSILGLAAEKHGKGEAFRSEILARKPAIGALST